MVIIVYRRKQMTLTAKMNKYVEDMELDIRNDIRQGQSQILTMHPLYDDKVKYKMCNFLLWCGFDVVSSNSCRLQWVEYWPVKNLERKRITFRLPDTLFKPPLQHDPFLCCTSVYTGNALIFARIWLPLKEARSSAGYWLWKYKCEGCGGHGACRTPQSCHTPLSKALLMVLVLRG